MDGIAGFDWDDGNRTKCQKHGVSVEDVEAALTSPLLVRFDRLHSQSEARHQAVGYARNGRPVFIVFTIRERLGKKVSRPISARYMHTKEVRRYEETHG